jgi:hypothetical protein
MAMGNVHTANTPSPAVGLLDLIAQPEKYRAALETYERREKAALAAEAAAAEQTAISVEVTKVSVQVQADAERKRADAEMIAGKAQAALDLLDATERRLSDRERALDARAAKAEKWQIEEETRVRERVLDLERREAAVVDGEKALRVGRERLADAEAAYAAKVAALKAIVC